jgi:hypothetical protein
MVGGGVCVTECTIGVYEGMNAERCMRDRTAERGVGKIARPREL